MKFSRLADFLHFLGKAVEGNARLLCHSQIRRQCKSSTEKKQSILYEQWGLFKDQSTVQKGLALLHALVSRLEHLNPGVNESDSLTIDEFDMNIDKFDMDIDECDSDY